MARDLTTRKRRGGVGGDVRGAVYVEFLLAFMPLFLLFLGICQLSLLTAGKLVVQHAALRAVRSAIVVLEESPADYDGAPRGSLSKGRGSDRVTRALLDALGLSASDAPAGQSANPGPQQGARMGPIRAAAYAPLFALSPRGSFLRNVGSETLAESVPAGLRDRLGSALAYTRAASVVTVHARDGVALASEPVDGRAAVTVRVTYLYPCAVPLVRVLMCRTLAALLGSTATAEAEGSPLFERMKLAEAPDDLSRIAAPTTRFVPLTADATLPNQGAAYYAGDKG